MEWFCAWKGCDEFHKKPMPRGWRNLLIWYSPEPQSHKTIGQVANSTDCDRDAALCPEHAAELERLLGAKLASHTVFKRLEH